MAQTTDFSGALGGAKQLEDFLRGQNTTGDPSLDSGNQFDLDKLRTDVESLRDVGTGLDASGATGDIISRFRTFNAGGGGIATDPEVSLATESNLLQQSNVLNAIRQNASLLGPGATAALGKTQGQALTDFGIARSNIPTEIRDKFFAQFTPLLQQALGTELSAKAATVGAEQGVQGFDVGITQQALSNSLGFGPIEEGRFGQQKELTSIGADAQVRAAQATAAGEKAGGTAGAVGSIVGAALPLLFSSDFRLKDEVDFIDEDKALEILNKIHGFKWAWKDGSGSDMGVIAQEVRKVFPEAVVEDPMTGILAVKYTALIGILITATGALTKKIEKLEQKEN